MGSNPIARTIIKELLNMGNPTERALDRRLKLMKEIVTHLDDESKSHCISVFCAWMSITDLKAFSDYLKEKTNES